MTSFFAQQDRARRTTYLLLLLMVLAIAIVSVAMFALLSLASVELVASEQWLYAGLGAVVVVGGGAAGRGWDLRHGGPHLAAALGGRRITEAAEGAHEQRLMNVVAEMAIAAGVPTPQVFVLDAEPGINAFAAGRSVHDAAIGVTRGCLEELSRDELQGVVAHELSHIVNGDTRLDLWVMVAVYGMIAVGLVGRWLIDAGWHRTLYRARLDLMQTEARHSAGASGSWGSEDDDASQRGPWMFLLLAAAVLALGWLGELLARMIQAAVSREREYLADASAVALTRNPAGLSGALRKIDKAGAQVRSLGAFEANHLFFCDTRKPLWPRLSLASHPPLSERIRRLEPAIGGDDYALSGCARDPA